MDFEAMLQLITPEVHSGLRRAIEIGKWADGAALTGEQRELCMQALIAWEVHNLPSEERTGHIDCGSKTRGEVCATPADEEPELIRIVRASGLAG